MAREAALTDVGITGGKKEIHALFIRNTKRKVLIDDMINRVAKEAEKKHQS